MPYAKPNKNRASLYDLDAEIAAALDDLDEGKDAEAMQRLETAQLERKAKVDAIAAAIKSYETHAELTAEELRRLTSRKKRSEAKAEWLRTYLAASMMIHGESRIDSPRFTVLCQPRPPVLDADDADIEAIERTNPELVRVKKELVRNDAKKFVERGNVLPGVKLQDGGYMVVLR